MRSLINYIHKAGDGIIFGLIIGLFVYFISGDEKEFLKTAILVSFFVNFINSKFKNF